MFKNFQSSSLPYLIGILAGIVLLWILLIIQKYLPNTFKSLSHRIKTTRDIFSSTSDVRLRNDIYRFTQKNHLASSMFSLDEIVVEPKVLTPLIQSSFSPDTAPSDCVSLAVPYIPDWPELSAVYNSSKMPLIDALQGNGNIILAGHSGTGKSVALAWLAGRLARNEKNLGKLADLLPIYVHATDLPFFLYGGDSVAENTQKEIEDKFTDNLVQTPDQIKNIDVVESLTTAISRYASPLILNRISYHVRSAIENHKSILILDKVDELPPNQAGLIKYFLQLIINKYPDLRIIIAMSYDNFAGLPPLGFSLIGMAPWTYEDQSEFLRLWNKQWKINILPIVKDDKKNINSFYLKNWLSISNLLLSPLEFTLKVWAAYAGDTLGADGPSSIEAYIRRVISDEIDVRTGLEQFAYQLLIETKSFSNPNNNARVLVKYKSDLDNQGNKEDSEAAEILVVNQRKAIKELNTSIFHSLSNKGILQKYHDDLYGFIHPVIFGYLAGKAIAEYGGESEFLQQPNWGGKNLAFHYLALFGDVTSILKQYIQDDDVLHTNHLLASRWLQIAPKNRPWRTIILRTLTSILQRERESITLAAKIMSALAFSGDAGVSIYFRQLLKSDHPNIKQIASLGCGILADKNSITDLNQLLEEDSPAINRSASLALAAIGDKKSLEILASNLLGGDELIRRYAAEALANNHTEGFQALTEGSSMDDLLVRRAVIFGLIRINQPWAQKIVENLQLEDSEWVVRNAAIQAFDELEKKKNLAPKTAADLTDMKWLINYAEKNGTRLAPGKPAEDLVKKALTNGTEDEKLFAIDYYRTNCDRNSIELIYSTFKNSKAELRDAAYYVLWLMKTAGFRLPLTFE
jgi:hypothetical protein